MNLLTLDPGVWSSQRHWHSHEDEFVSGQGGYRRKDGSGFEP